MNKLMLVATFCAVIPMIATGEATDDQLKNILHRATQYIDDPHGGPGEVRYAIRLSNNDTNRVVSLMKQLIDEGVEDDSTTQFYISEIGKHGTHSDLPFLYQRVSSTNLCEHATAAILKIEGLTTNSLMRIESSIPDTMPEVRDSTPVHAWCRLLEAAEKCPAGAMVKTLTISNAVLYASRQRKSVEMLDDCITAADPTYRTSKRRLAVMRSVRDLGVNEWQTNFVTRAIRELVAYPEANLPE